MFLNDENYEDETGNRISRSEVDSLGTHKHVVDGFFTWCCGNCKKESSTRGFRIGGAVWTCGACGKKNLLVRTDIKFLNQKLASADRNETSAEKAILNSLKHFGEGIAALGRR